MGVVRRSLDFIGIPRSWQELFPSKPDGRSNAIEHFLSLMPLLFSIVWLFFAVYYDSVLQAVNQRRAPMYQVPLADTGHRLIPWLIYTTKNGTQNVHNIYVGVWGAVTAVRFVFTGRLFLTLLRRFFFIWGLMFIFRGTSLGMTQYPNTDGTLYPLCQVNMTAGKSVWMQGWYIMFGYNTTCTDFMFSGHTVACTLLTLQWTTYAKNDFSWLINLNRMPKLVRRLLRPRLDSVGDPDGQWLISFLAWSVLIGCIFVLIAGRIHYTDDCIMGWLICTTWYKMYCYYLKTVYERNTWFSNFIIWFEGLSLPDTNVHDGMTTSDLYVYQPMLKRRLMYHHEKIEHMPDINDVKQAHTQALDPNYNPNIVLVTIPNEINQYHPLQYFSYGIPRRDIAVNTSGTPTNWAVQPEYQ